MAGVAGQVFNVGCGASHTLIDLCHGIEATIRRSLQIEFAPPREGDIRHSLADITAARERLRYDPIIKFGRGLERTIHWAVESPLVGRRLVSSPASACAC